MEEKYEDIHKPVTTNTELHEAFKFTTPVAVVLSGIIIAFAIVFSGGNFFHKNNNETLKDPELLAQVSQIIENPTTLDYEPVNTEDFVHGNPNAPLTFITYTDLECPFCKRFHLVMNMLINDDKNQNVKLVYRQFPIDSLHKKARNEALATECAGSLGGNDGFWKFVDELFKKTRSNDSLDPKQLPEIATTVGLNLEQWNTCMTENKLAENVNKDIESGNKIGVNGTPSTLIVTKNGQIYQLEGYRSYSVVKEVVRQLSLKK